MSKRRVIRWVSVSFCALLAPLALGGDLSPPAGPVVETMKTLDEVEPRIPIHQEDVPFTITIPGSYYLTENLTFPAATSGFVVFVSVDDVTLDLNGFAIDGQDVDGDAFGVIGISVTSDDVMIRNGQVLDAAICVTAQSTRRVFVDSVRATPIAGGTGFQASNDATISNCEVDGGAIGIDTTVASNFMLKDCVVRDVSDACYEFKFNVNGHIEDCVAFSGTYGYRLGDSADDLVFVDCVANSCSIGFSDLSGQTNFFFRNIVARSNIAYQNVANVSATPATAGPWDNISQ